MPPSPSSSAKTTAVSPTQPVDLRGPRARHPAADRLRSAAAALQPLRLRLAGWVVEPPETGLRGLRLPGSRQTASSAPATASRAMSTATADPRPADVATEDSRVVVTPDTSLFPPDRLVEHARQLGQTHKVERQPRGRGRGLLARLDAAAERLEAVYLALSASPDDSRLPSEDWIRDNFYVVVDQVRQVRTDLPTALLPRVAATGRGPVGGLSPRVLAGDRVGRAQRQPRSTSTCCARSCCAYQESHPLRIGEIWAIPIMLRMALVERLCVLADDVLRARLDRVRAQEIVVAAGAAGRRQTRTALAVALGDRAARSRSRRRLSWSCCAGCAIGRRRWRQPGRNCSSRCTRRAAPTR